MERQAPATALMWACPMASKSALCPEAGPFWLPCALPRYFATGPCRTHNPQSGDTASSCAVCLDSCFFAFLLELLVHNACFYNLSYTTVAVEAGHTHSHMHAHTYACMHTLAHAHTHSRMHTRTHACTYSRMHACTHAHMHTDANCI